MNPPNTTHPQTETPAYRSVATKIERMLTSDELTPGDPLPNETDLATKFGVSRSTIRESLRLLEDTGYVHRVSPRKLVAAIPDAKHLATRTARALYANRVTVREVWEMILALEPAMAFHAAKRASDDEIAALRTNVDETMLAHERGEDLSQLDLAFHSKLGEASHHKAMQIVLEPYKALFMPMVDGLVHRLDMQPRLITAHQRVVEAIERRDSKVAELWMQRHQLDFERGCRFADIELNRPFDIETLARMQ